ncbi:MAG: tyrosine-protein phosphatase [Gemmataceae bacterium]
MVPQIVRSTLGGLIICMIVGVPIAYSRYTYIQQRHFAVVKEGVLYRSGQMTRAGLKKIIKYHGIRTVITLRAAREEGQPHPDADEEVWCNKQQIYYYRLPPKQWYEVDGKIPGNENVKRFLEVMADPKHHPVLMHCFRGHHRTGIMTAIYRMEVDGWSNEKAIDEMVASGHDRYDMHADVQTYLESYKRGILSVSHSQDANSVAAVGKKCCEDHEGNCPCCEDHSH